MRKILLRMNNRPRRFLRFGLLRMRFAHSENKQKSAEASAEAAEPLGEPTILCSRRMKVS